MASTRGTGLLLAGLAAMVAVAVLPSAASAAVTCSFTSGGSVTVDITAGDNVAEVRNNGGTIEVLNGSAALQACSPNIPTTADTTSIVMNDTVAGQSSTFLVDLSGALGPGTPAEGTGASEIEVTANANDGAADRLQLIGAALSADTYRFGALSATAVGANVNNDDDNDDVVINDGERLNASTFGGDDVIDASGGSGFTGPVPYDVNGSAAVRFTGGAQNDTVRAGSGSSFLDGGADNDTLTGGAGVDEIELGTGGGNDVADGAGGADFANYQFSPLGSLSVDLGVVGPQNTGIGGTDTLSNFERLVGSQQSGGADTLIGDAGPNQINANEGNDVLIGKGGDDTLNGGPGGDTASYALGSSGPVSVDLGSVGAQATGGAGTDTLGTIENLIGTPFGSDNLIGNANANQIDAYDGFGDTVDCVGPTGGNAVVDEIGVDSVANCDTTDNAPQTTIASGPEGGATVTNRAPVYGLTADEPSSFQYRVDSGTFTPCAATCAVSSLADGPHTLAFRAIDSDENGHADLTPATRNVVVDATAPETVIGSHPKPKTKSRKATFTFSASEPGSTFLCSYDGKPYAACPGAFTTPKLKPGRHRFDVISTDAAGNRDASAATFLWKVKKRRRR